MNCTDFSEVTPCSPVEAYRRFGEVYYLACSLILAGYLLGLLLYHKVGHRLFLLKKSENFYQTTRRYNPKDALEENTCMQMRYLQKAKVQKMFMICY
jgi:hypothetical protein